MHPWPPLKPSVILLYLKYYILEEKIAQNDPHERRNLLIKVAGYQQYVMQRQVLKV